MKYSFYFLIVLLVAVSFNANAQWYVEIAASDSRIDSYSVSGSTATTPISFESFKGFRDFSYGFGYLFTFKSLETRMKDDYKIPLLRLGLGLGYDQLNINGKGMINNVAYPSMYNLAQMQGKVGLNLTPFNLSSEGLDRNGNAKKLISLNIQLGAGYNIYTYAAHQSASSGGTTLTNLLDSETFKSNYPFYFYGAGLNFMLSKQTSFYVNYNMEHAISLNETANLPNSQAKEEFDLVKNKISVGIVVDFAAQKTKKRYEKIQATEVKSSIDEKVNQLQLKQDESLLNRIVALENQLEVHGHDFEAKEKINETIFKVTTHQKGFMYFPDFARVLFPLNSAEFDTIKYKEHLENLAKFLTQNQLLKIKLVGYADASGGTKHNLELSRKRAKSVKDYLTTEHNVPADQIMALGVGETNQFSISEPSHNRRTEILIFYK